MLYVGGVTYGPFRPRENGSVFRSPGAVDRDFAQIATNRLHAYATTPHSCAGTWTPRNDTALWSPGESLVTLRYAESMGSAGSVLVRLRGTRRSCPASRLERSPTVHRRIGRDPWRSAKGTKISVMRCEDCGSQTTVRQTLVYGSG